MILNCFHSIFHYLLFQNMTKILENMKNVEKNEAAISLLVLL